MYDNSLLKQPVALFVDGKINPEVIEYAKTEKFFQDEEEKNVKDLNRFLFNIARVFGQDLTVNQDAPSWHGWSMRIMLNHYPKIIKDAQDGLLSVSLSSFYSIEKMGLVTFNLQSKTFLEASNQYGSVNTTYGTARYILGQYQKKINHYIKRNELKRHQIIDFVHLLEAQGHHFALNTKEVNREVGGHYLARIIKENIVSRENLIYFAVKGTPGNLVPLFKEAPLEWLKEIL